MKPSCLPNLQRTKERVRPRIRIAATLSILLRVFTGALFFCFGHPALGLATAKTSLPQSSEAASHLKFTLVNSGRSLMPGGIVGSFSHYKSEDGVLVEYMVEGYKSKREARSELERLTKHALKVIQKNTKTDADGHEIGDRVELKSRMSKRDSEQAIVAWVDGQKLVKLMSPSRKHVLDFEAEVYHASLPKTPPKVQ